MAKEITMPKLSDTMTDGLFITWRKKIGDRIERGDIIAEVETDKAVMELEAFASGFLIKTMATKGESVPVGTVLGLIGEAGELAATEEEAAPALAAPTPEPAPTAQPLVAEPAAAVQSESVPAWHAGTEHEKASPMVRHMARELGIDLGTVNGSGPDGRITQEDLQALASQRTASAPSTEETVEKQEAYPEQQPVLEGLSPMRQAIAASVNLSWQQIPHYSVTMEINMDACREIVRELKDAEHRVGYNSIVIKACAMALKSFPLLHTVHGEYENEIPISFAVSLTEGLQMPVVRNCQQLSLAEIEQETARLAYKSRDGRLTSEEMSGGSFSLTNLGMYGVDNFTALIVPGQTAILAVGAVAERPIVRDGQIVAAHTMRVTLSCDHRIVDGAYAAAFLAELRRILEHPITLLV